MVITANVWNTSLTLPIDPLKKEEINKSVHTTVKGNITKINKTKFTNNSIHKLHKNGINNYIICIFHSYSAGRVIFNVYCTNQCSKLKKKQS